MTQIAPDTAWNDDEIVMSDMTPDTDFVFERMTLETIAAVDPKPGELVLDVACGRGIDALSLAEKGASLVGIEASSVMIDKALEFLGDKKDKVVLARALAEDLPFPDDTFDKVVCKGAMDHFANIEESMAEMARITKPGGKVIIAIANFESLTCIIGRNVWGRGKKALGKDTGEHPFWEPPDDHNFKFDVPVLKNLMGKHCRVEKVLGLSMLWGLPKWGATLRKVKPGTAASILKALDAGARLAPSLSDVLIATGTPRK